jgi:hypothetical protein
MPDLTQVAHAIQTLRQPVVIVQQPPPSDSETKHLARIQELEETESKNSARLAELEKTFSSLLSLVHAKDRIEEVTTPKHDIVVTEDAVFVADGLNLSKYARVKLPLFQALKRWAMRE